MKGTLWFQRLTLLTIFTVTINDEIFIIECLDIASKKELEEKVRQTVVSGGSSCFTSAVYGENCVHALRF